jgi:hypothetical protein
MGSLLLHVFDGLEPLNRALSAILTPLHRFRTVSEYVYRENVFHKVKHILRQVK